MIHTSTKFLQALTVFVGVSVFAFMLYFPLTEGRAQDLDLFQIYLDPFILYGYTSSLVFYYALYQAFLFFGLVNKNEVFSLKSINVVKRFKQCVLLLIVLIVLAGLFIKLFHHQDDDPAGFLAISLVAIFITIVISALAAVLEKIIQQGIDLKH